MKRNGAFLVTCRVALVAAAALVLSAGCVQETGVSTDWERVEPPKESVDFSVQQLDGSAVSLSGYRGRVVVMEFWATWCGPCRFSLPSLEVIYKRFRDRGVTVLLINQGEDADRVRKWAERRFTAPILLDTDQHVGRLYGVSGIPRLFIVDQAGRIVYAHAGYGGGLERNLALILEQLLSGSAQPTNG